MFSNFSKRERERVRERERARERERERNMNDTYCSLMEKIMSLDLRVVDGNVNCCPAVELATGLDPSLFREDVREPVDRSLRVGANGILPSFLGYLIKCHMDCKIGEK
jgi:hypothetical protein